MLFLLVEDATSAAAISPAAPELTSSPATLTDPMTIAQMTSGSMTTATPGILIRKIREFQLFMSWAF